MYPFIVFCFLPLFFSPLTCFLELLRDIEAEKLGFEVGWKGLVEGDAQFMWNPRAHD